jgi:hypothetical protein
VSLVRVHSFSISLDGFGAGEPQSRDAPFGHAGERLHEWMITTRWWREMRPILGLTNIRRRRSGSGLPTGGLAPSRWRRGRNRAATDRAFGPQQSSREVPCPRRQGLGLGCLCAGEDVRPPNSTRDACSHPGWPGARAPRRRALRVTSRTPLDSQTPMHRLTTQ